MSNFKNPMHQQMHAQSYAKWQEGNLLGLQKHRLEQAWPSTNKETPEGMRGATSPLGGMAVQKEPQR
jgi:hypothetical protein